MSTYNKNYSKLSINTQGLNRKQAITVPRQLENELLRNNLFENGVSTLSLENQKKKHKIIKTKKKNI